MKYIIKDRINKIFELNPTTSDILISNHVNVGGDQGGEVIYSVRGTKTLPQKIANNLAVNNLNIRNVYQKRNRLGKDFYFILRETLPTTSMIIEYGFANNEYDTNLLRTRWFDLAEAVVTLHGCHVVSFAPRGSREVLWVSGKSRINCWLP